MGHGDGIDINSTKRNFWPTFIVIFLKPKPKHKFNRNPNLNQP